MSMTWQYQPGPTGAAGAGERRPGRGPPAASAHISAPPPSLPSAREWGRRVPASALAHSAGPPAAVARSAWTLLPRHLCGGDVRREGMSANLQACSVELKA